MITLRAEMQAPLGHPLSMEELMGLSGASPIASNEHSSGLSEANAIVLPFDCLTTVAFYHFCDSKSHFIFFYSPTFPCSNELYYFDNAFPGSRCSHLSYAAAAQECPHIESHFKNNFHLLCAVHPYFSSHCFHYICSGLFFIKYFRHLMHFSRPARRQSK